MNLNRVYTIFLLIFILGIAKPEMASSQAIDQAKGKIMGRVKDEGTGTLLASVNVFLKNTALGDVTDESGYFEIKGVPPGEYTLVISMIGYSKETRHVKIEPGATVVLSIPIKRVPIEFKPITVSTETPMIERHMISARVVLGKEELEKMPTLSITDVISQQIGTIKRGGLHIRGGRAGEVLFILDGCLLMDPFYNVLDVSLPQCDIKEVRFHRGGFGVEYGQAQSGVVDITSKTGTEKLETDFAYMTNDFRSEWLTGFHDFLDRRTNKENLNKFSCTVGGPFPTQFLNRKTSFFLAGQVQRSSGSLGDDYTNDDSFFAKLIFKPNTKCSIRLAGILSSRDFHEYGFQWKNIHEHCPYGFRETKDFNIAYSQVLGTRTSVEVHFDRHFTGSGYNVLEDGMIGDIDGVDDFADRDNDGNVEINGIERNTSWKDIQYNFDRPRDDAGFYIGGFSSYAWHNRKASVTSINTNFAHRISDAHEIKAGSSFRHYDLFYYGVDMIGPGIRGVERYEAYPYQGGAYLQNKINFEAMIIVTGIRFDYFNPRWNLYPKDPFDPIISPEGGIKNPTTVPAKYKVSPRIGVSLPVTHRDVLHGTYGHYFQVPAFSFLYKNAYYDFSVSSPVVGNPDLEPEKTISYELGLIHTFTPQIVSDVTAFWKDMRGLVGVEQIICSPAFDYSKYTNCDYANAKGIEFILRKEPGGILKWLSLTLSYTYSFAWGKSSIRCYGDWYTQSGYTLPSGAGELWLDWDQRHTIKLGFNFTVREKEYLLGQRFLSNFWISVFTNYGSGLPYTIIPDSPWDPVTQERLDWVSTTDMRIHKNMNIYGYKLSLFADVRNLFDKSDNLTGVVDPRWYAATGDPTGIWDDPTVWSPRRTISLGVEAKF
jgi:outer membrane receptor protein involved in Fe transport